MSHRGNRPDCAYFLLLGVALAAFFLTLGGVCTYVALWPEAALAHETHHTSSRVLDRMLPKSEDSEDSEVPTSSEDGRTGRNEAMKVVGPLGLVLGFFVLTVVGIYAVKYRCDYEPEEPNIAFLRLASEMSLNFDPERSKYKLMPTQTQEFPLQGVTIETNTGPSTSKYSKY